MVNKITETKKTNQLEKVAIEQDLPLYGSSLTAAEPFATEYIPLTERHGHPRHQFTLWFAANMVLAVMVSGFFSSLFGLSVIQGLSAVAVGSGLGAVIMGVLAGIGTKMGVPQQVQARGPMGYVANFIPISLLTIVSATGWTAVNTAFAVMALQVLIDTPFWIAAFFIFGVQTLFAIWGHNIIHLMNIVASVILGVLFAFITVLSLQQVDSAIAVNTEAPLYIGELAGWLTFAGFFFSYVMTWTPFASDFSRYLPQETSHIKVTLYTSGGSFLSLMWLGGIGVLVSSFAGGLEAIPALAALTGSWAPIAMITIVLSTIPVSAMNLYGGSLSLLTIHIPVSRIIGVVIVSIIGFVMTLLMANDPYGNFYDFLSLLAYLVIPFTTVLLLDYYIRMRHMGKQAVDELFIKGRKVERGFFAWIIGCFCSSFFWHSSLLTGVYANEFSSIGDLSFLVGAITAAISYLIFYKLRPNNMKVVSTQEVHNV